MKFLFSLFALIMLSESCNSSKKAIENSSKMQNTLSGSYSITQIGNNKSIPPKLTIVFDEKSNKVNGFAGCNRFFGSYVIQNNSIAFSNIASSKKFCGKEIMALENHVLKALNRVDSFTIKDNVLTLLENETTLLNANLIPSTKKSDIVKGNYDYRGVTYQTSSKGAFVYIHITENQLSYSTDVGLKKMAHYNYDHQDWEILNELIDNVDSKTFHKLEAPTDKHLSDGAAHTTLAILNGDVEIMSPTFDHGHPPKEIEALVNKVLSIKEKTIKQ